MTSTTTMPVADAAPVALTIEELCPVMTQHLDRLRAFAPAPRGAPWLAAETTSTIRAELSLVLGGTSDEDFCARAASMIVAAYPQAVADPEGLGAYMSMMAEDLAEFAPAIIKRAMIKVRRTIKFRPSIAEVYEACTDVRTSLETNLSALRWIDLQRIDHEAEMEREAERRDRTRDAYRKIVDLLTERYGELPLVDPVDSLRCYEAFMKELRIGWGSSIVDAGRWAVVSLVRFDLCRDALMMTRFGALTEEQGRGVVKAIIAGDITAARHTLDVPEAAITVPEAPAPSASDLRLWLKKSVEDVTSLFDLMRCSDDAAALALGIQLGPPGLAPADRPVEF